MPKLNFKSVTTKKGEHPGKIFYRICKANGIGLDRISTTMNIPMKILTDLIACEVGINVDLAMKLGEFFKNRIPDAAMFFITLQDEYNKSLNTEKDKVDTAINKAKKRLLPPTCEYIYIDENNYYSNDLIKEIVQKLNKSIAFRNDNANLFGVTTMEESNGNLEYFEENCSPECKKCLENINVFSTELPCNNICLLYIKKMMDMKKATSMEQSTDNPSEFDVLYNENINLKNQINRDAENIENMKSTISSFVDSTIAMIESLVHIYNNIYDKPGVRSVVVQYLEKSIIDFNYILNRVLQDKHIDALFGMEFCTTHRRVLKQKSHPSTSRTSLEIISPYQCSGEYPYDNTFNPFNKKEYYPQFVLPNQDRFFQIDKSSSVSHTKQHCKSTARCSPFCAFFPICNKA